MLLRAIKLRDYLRVEFTDGVCNLSPKKSPELNKDKRKQERRSFRGIMASPKSSSEMKQNVKTHAHRDWTYVEVYISKDQKRVI